MWPISLPVVFWICHHFPPPPGWAVVALAFLAAIMTLYPPLQGKDGRWQRAAWIVVFGFLGVFELWAISHDRAEQDRLHTEDMTKLNAQFIDTLNRIGQTRATLGQTSSQLGQVQLRLHAVQVQVAGLQKGQGNQTLLIQQIKEDATKPLSDLPSETVRRLIGENYQRLIIADELRYQAIQGPLWSPTYRDRLPPAEKAKQRQDFYNTKMEEYRRQLGEILPEADTLRTLILKKIGAHSEEDDHEGDVFKAAINGRVQDFSARKAADYLMNLSNRLPK